MTREEIKAAVKQAVKEEYKKDVILADFSGYKEGEVKHIIGPSDYITDLIYDVIFEMTGENYWYEPIPGMTWKEELRYAAEGILEVWKEKTGRDDLYVMGSDCETEFYICG